MGVKKREKESGRNPRRVYAIELLSTSFANWVKYDGTKLAFKDQPFAPFCSLNNKLIWFKSLALLEVLKERMLGKSLFLLLLGVLYSCIGVQAQSPLTTIQPIDGENLFDSTVVFHWNKHALETPGSTYIIALSQDPNFSTTIYTNSNLNNYRDTVVLSNPGSYFWRLDLLDNTQQIQASSIFHFTYVDIYEMSGISILLQSDTGLVLGASNEVQKWYNLADTFKSALPPTISQQPLFVSSVGNLKNRPTVRLDGTDDLLEINGAMDIAEIYAVANWGSGTMAFPSYNGLLSGKSTYYIFIADGAGGNKTTLLNAALFPSIFINHTLTKDFAPLAEHKFLNARRTTTFNVPDFQIGRDRALNTRHWNGDIAEVIGFAAPLSDSVRKIVSDYLCKKYSTPFSLGADISIPYGFCDTLVSVSNTYSSYTWSNGSTSNTANLSPGNTYQLTVTGDFGCEFSDEIRIEGTSLTSPGDQVICPLDSFVWDTGLPTTDYSFLWSDNSTDSLLIIKNPGEYYVTITDTNACSYYSDTITLSIDSTLLKLSLGNDTSVCRGNSIALINPIPSITSYLWSTGNTTATQVIDTAGTYTLKIGDGKCLVEDTILVTLKGEAPITNFVFQKGFLSDTIVFEDRSQAPGTGSIISWDWDFGDGTTSSDQNPKHKYTALGSYQVRLRVTANGGCFSEMVKTVNIGLRPPVINPDTAFDRLTTIRPGLRTSVYDRDIIFEWNNSWYEKPGTQFTITIAGDSLFSNVVYTKAGIAGHSDTLSLSASGKYFWKVELLDGTALLTSSFPMEFTYVDMYSLTNLSLMLRADTGVVLGSGNQVQEWRNLADITNNALQSTPSSQPLLVNNIAAINEQSAIRLDGVDDFMGVNSSLGLGEVFVVANWAGATPTFPSYNGLLTSQSSFYILIADGSGGNKTTFFTGSILPNIKINGVDTLDFAPLNDYKIVSASRSLGAINFNDLYLGRDRGQANRFWNGDIAEVIGFSNTLSDSLRKLVNTYLCNKYGKPLSLGEDILLPYGFCDTLVSADTSYTSYLWSNGATTNATRLMPGKSYQLTVTSSFGCEFTDEISIVPALKSQGSVSLCIGDSLVWDTELEKAAYSFEWSDNSSDSLLTIKTPGMYQVLITDTNGCSFQMDRILLSYDSSLLAVSLGNDTAVCKGEPVNIINPLPLTPAYRWSTGNQTASQIIDTAGTYTLRIDDGKCVAHDTVVVSIQGLKPVAAFSSQNFCFQDTVEFNDQSIPPVGDNIVNWAWDFDDGSNGTSATTQHRYNTVSDFDVVLKVTTDKGCIDSIVNRLSIQPKPTANFSSRGICSKEEVDFTNGTTINRGRIVSLRWNFGDPFTQEDTSLLSAPSYTYDTLGVYSISLIAESDQGCLDTVIIPKQINPTPNVDFSFRGNCLADSTHFIDETILASGNVLDYRWIVNNQVSLLQNPAVKYNNSGAKIVVLRVRTDSLCQAIHRDTIEISENPIANFSFDQSCVELPIQVNDLSQSVDPIVSYDYTFSAGGTAGVPNPVFIENTAGSHTIQLKIETDKACADSITKSIEIYPKPIANFRVLNDEGGAPMLLYLENNTSGANQYKWDFGNGASSSQELPQYTYQNAGTYRLSLTAISSEGCIDSTFETLTVVPYFLDANLEEINLRELGKGELAISVRVINTGFNTIERLSLVADLNNEFQLIETFEETIFRGERGGFMFSGNFLLDESKKVDFVCVRIRSVNGVKDDDLSNNEQCEKGFSKQFFVNTYPNPAREYLTLDFVLPLRGDLAIRIYDNLGREVIKVPVKVYDAGYYSSKIDLTGLRTGVFHYSIEYNGTNENGVFIKE
jgi:PKD repeat protein